MGISRHGRYGLALVLVPIAALASAAPGDDDAGKKTATGCCACCSSSKAGGLSGVWTGEYRYAEGTGQRPVAFTAFLFQDGDRIKAMIKEANTFGDQQSPWLHATAEGRYDEATHTLRFTKTYDGTAGVSHNVAYSGVVASEGGRSMEGTWDIDGVKGSFAMRRSASVD
ncbi:hypothetical protein [Paludisphaera rhizosphaerae]|uniref:hypothetical protein n=1 Tax=Paludisphaera rhizosphaerae TaxID=2711216 RepID=UPI0013ECA5E4|nr:hypothetical protein [Paludisphaera rhizosphaerae]